MGIRAIEEWQAPTKVSSFLGLVNYLLPKIHRRLLEATHKSPKEGRTDHGTALVGCQRAFEDPKAGSD